MGLGAQVGCFDSTQEGAVFCSFFFHTTIGNEKNRGLLLFLFFWTIEKEFFFLKGHLLKFFILGFFVKTKVKAFVVWNFECLSYL